MESNDPLDAINIFKQFKIRKFRIKISTPFGSKYQFIKFVFWTKWGWYFENEQKFQNFGLSNLMI